MVKELTQKVRKFLGLIPTFVEVAGKKTGTGVLAAPVLKRVKYIYITFSEHFFCFLLAKVKVTEN